MKYLSEPDVLPIVVITNEFIIMLGRLWYSWEGIYDILSMVCQCIMYVNHNPESMKRLPHDVYATYHSKSTQYVTPMRFP